MKKSFFRFLLATIFQKKKILYFYNIFKLIIVLSLSNKNTFQSLFLFNSIKNSFSKLRPSPDII